MENNEIEQMAFRKLSDYIKESKLPLINLTNISGLKKGDNGVFADCRAENTKTKQKVYFEIKGTTKGITSDETVWGAVTHKEIRSAIQAPQKQYSYYFVVVNVLYNQFIHPRRNNKNNDPYSVFMSLEEILTFSKRAKLTVDFEMICDKNNFDNPQIRPFQDKKKRPFTKSEMETLINRLPDTI